jgi:hypothetical protein
MTLAALPQNKRKRRFIEEGDQEEPVQENAAVAEE